MLKLFIVLAIASSVCAKYRMRRFYGDDIPSRYYGRPLPIDKMDYPRMDYSSIDYPRMDYSRMEYPNTRISRMDYGPVRYTRNPMVFGDYKGSFRAESRDFEESRFRQPTPRGVLTDDRSSIDRSPAMLEPFPTRSFIRRNDIETAKDAELTFNDERNRFDDKDMDKGRIEYAGPKYQYRRSSVDYPMSYAGYHSSYQYRGTPMYGPFPTRYQSDRRSMYDPFYSDLRPDVASTYGPVYTRRPRAPVYSRRLYSTNQFGYSPVRGPAYNPMVHPTHRNRVYFY